MDVGAKHLAQYPRSLLGKRTPEQYEFDRAVKGWAFMARNPAIAQRAKLFASKLGPTDERQETLAAILKSHE